MIVVVIIGILAASAIPVFAKYIRRSKTTEARLLLRKIYDGEVAYFDVEHSDRSGNHLSAEFVSAGPQPASVPGENKVVGNFSSVGWEDLKFSTDSPVLYRFQALAVGVGTSSSFSARAEGDLDGDGNTSLFERTASIDQNGNVSGSSGLYIVNDIE